MLGLAINASLCSLPRLTSSDEPAFTSALHASPRAKLTPRASAAYRFSPTTLPRSFERLPKQQHGRSFGINRLGRILRLQRTKLLYLVLAISLAINMKLLSVRAAHIAIPQDVADDWLGGYTEGYEEALRHVVAPAPTALPGASASYRSLWDASPRPTLENSTTAYTTTPVNPATVCVLMTDSRPLAPIPNDFVDADQVPFPTASAYLNMHWALRHGYRFIHRGLEGRDMPGYHITWWRLPGMIETVSECAWVVYFDGDAFVNAPEYSLDDMRLQWGMHDEASILMADEARGQPEGNVGATNAGFWIIRRSEVSLRALRDLLECPEKHSACEHRKRDFSHEQKAFADFVRPTLRDGIDFVVAPCDEANGYWSFWGECSGRITTHAWLAKADVAKRTVGVLAREWLSMLERTSRSSASVQILPS